MNTLEILKNRKEEIIEKTIEILPVALAGDRANRTFFVKIDDEGNLKVDYFYYAGQIVLNDNCFFTIKDHETPDPEDYGYDNIEEMDFAACGFDENIENSIDNHIANLELAE